MGQAFGIKAGTTSPFFFAAEVKSGSVQRQKFVPGKFAAEAVTTLGKLPVGTNSFGPSGPQGMVYDSVMDVLYVVSTADNSIVAFPNATTAFMSASPVTVYQGGRLNAPVGIATNPITGSLLVVNQQDNNLVEIQPNPIVSSTGTTYGAEMISVKLLDKSPVDIVKARDRHCSVWRRLRMRAEICSFISPTQTQTH